METTSPITAVISIHHHLSKHNQIIRHALLTNHTLLEQLSYYLKITKHDIDLTTLQTNITAKLQHTKTCVLLTKA